MNIAKIAKLSVFLIGLLCISAVGHKTKSVLVIGDSISIGYTPFIEKALGTSVTVSHNPGNGGSTLRGVQQLENWLDHKEWDVIVFNFGLHDMTYKDSLNKYDVANGKIAVPLADYQKNLETIVARLKKTTSTLLFVSTTMVPENSPGRKTESPAAYNQVALAIMKKNGIEVIDLYQTSLSVHPENSKPGNVHYTAKGYALLAEPIVDKIKHILQKEK